MDKIWTEISAIVVGIIGLAFAAVLVSRNAQTVGVITAGSRGLSTLIGAAVAPVSGAVPNGGLSNLATDLPYFSGSGPLG